MQIVDASEVIDVDEGSFLIDSEADYFYWKADDLRELAERQAQSKREFVELNATLRKEAESGRTNYIYDGVMDLQWRSALSKLGFLVTLGFGETIVDWSPVRGVKREAEEKLPPAVERPAKRARVEPTVLDAAVVATCEHEWHIDAPSVGRFPRERCALCQTLRRLCHACGKQRFVTERNFALCCSGACLREYDLIKKDTSGYKAGLQPCDKSACPCNTGERMDGQEYWTCLQYRRGCVHTSRRKCALATCGLLRNDWNAGLCKHCMKLEKAKYGVVEESSQRPSRRAKKTLPAVSVVTIDVQ